MRTIQLVETVYSSALGFGCAPILGSIDARTARRALDVALECGITHFDVARSYGYGEAERFVGQVVRGRRDQVVLASKFGITANWKASLLRPTKPLVRFAQRRRKMTRPIVETAAHGGATAPRSAPSVADRFHDRIPLTGDTMRRSLERTLKALGTDYLDVFFVHEPVGYLAQIEELCAIAESLKDQGKIRGWGLAYDRSHERAHRSYLDRFDVLQFDNSPGAPGYEAVVAQRGLAPNVLFSTLRGGTQAMSPADKLRRLSQDFPRSVLLCSMYNEQHLRENVQAVDEFA